MSEVIKRYDFETVHSFHQSYGEVTERENGDYVLFEDYEQQAKQIEALEKAIIAYCDEFLHNMCFETDREKIDYMLEFPLEGK